MKQKRVGRMYQRGEGRTAPRLSLRAKLSTALTRSFDEVPALIYSAGWSK